MKQKKCEEPSYSWQTCHVSPQIMCKRLQDADIQKANGLIKPYWHSSLSSLCSLHDVHLPKSSIERVKPGWLQLHMHRTQSTRSLQQHGSFGSPPSPSERVSDSIYWARCRRPGRTRTTSLSTLSENKTWEKVFGFESEPLKVAVQDCITHHLFLGSAAETVVPGSSCQLSPNIRE